MPSLTSGIQTALSAVLAHSQAIEIIEHNVANVNTPGYRRQSASLASTVASPILGYESSMAAGMRGTGVMIDKIKRFNVEFFDTRYRASAGETKNWETRRDLMVQLESALAETSQTGLLPKMDKFWDGWQRLASDPTNTALRANLLDETQSMVSAFNMRAQQLAQLRVDQNITIRGDVEEINNIASQIANLNVEISKVLSFREQPNDLLDKRDLLLDRLSELTGVTANVQANGEMIVSIGGHVLVNSGTALQLRAEVDPASPERNFRILWQDGQVLTPTSGELQGLFHVRDTVIPSQQAGLNNLAMELANQVNALHTNGYDLNGVRGLPLFTGTDADSLRLNSAISTNELAAASASGEPGNAAMANQIAALKTAKLMNGGTATLNEFYNSQITSLGLDTQRAKSNASNNGLLFQSISDQRDAVSGVSLDEEAADLMKYQKAYQAAARVMTAYDEMLDRIINGMGIVGR